MSPDNELQTEVRRLEGKMEAMEARILAAIKELREDTSASTARIEAKQSARDKVCASADAANLARDRELRDLKDAVRNYAAYDARIARIEVSVASLVRFGWILVAAVAGLLVNATWSTVVSHMADRAAGG